MNNYETIIYFLANYMDINIGYSEDEIVEGLEDELTDPEFKDAMATELNSALKDNDFSWKETLSEYQAGYFDTEEAARNYVKGLLWNVVFPSG